MFDMRRKLQVEQLERRQLMAGLIPIESEAATIAITADNNYAVFVNGAQVGGDARPGNSWTSIEKYNLNLKAGDTIAVSATDAGGLASMIASIRFANGTEVTSDAQWKVTDKLFSDWAEQDFDDASWADSTEHYAADKGPWKMSQRADYNLIQNSKWIWASDANAVNQVYFRLTLENEFVGPPSIFQDPTLSSVIYASYADSLIDRTEMIGILRAAGNNSVVTQTELADLQLLVTTTVFVMPNYVRDLASDVVLGNQANAKFQGQALGNLAAGSTEALLTKLIDKWFMGSDVPALLNGGATYQQSTGTLFARTPSLADAKQGQVGDCYFVVAVVAIADKDPQAVRDMFIDNGDGTFTVRFFASGVADYVTVNRQLPTNSSGNLVYSGSGWSAFSESTTLWVALAEKAYAQWNETGKAGRNGTNTYSGIVGGWMHNTNAQVLGYSSSNHFLSSSTPQAMIDAMAAGKAVTIGTYGSVGNGLVGGHAYTVTGYDPVTQKFTLDNPWGYNDPVPLTWTQLVSNCILWTATVV